MRFWRVVAYLSKSPGARVAESRARRDRERDEARAKLREALSLVRLPDPGGLPGATRLYAEAALPPSIRLPLLRYAGRVEPSYARWMRDAEMPPLSVELRTVVNPEPVREEWTGPPHPDTVFSYLPAWRRRG